MSTHYVAAVYIERVDINEVSSTRPIGSGPLTEIKRTVTDLGQFTVKALQVPELVVRVKSHLDLVVGEEIIDPVRKNLR